MSHLENGVKSVKQEDNAANNANLSVHKKGISQNEMVEGYNKWADHYDEDLCPDRYRGPSIIADVVWNHYGDDKLDAKIIDIAAGTGFLGKELSKKGFTNIDALEPAQNMIDRAKKKNIYTRFFCSAIGNDKTEIEDDTYDCIASSGGMGEGHIPCVALNEMIRIVKPGGMIFIVMREAYLSCVQEYIDRLEPLMETLESDGKWAKEGRDLVPGYSFENTGVVFKFRVK